MAVVESDLKAMFADRDEMRRIVEEQNRITGFVPDPNVSIEEMQATVAASLLAAGIRPEDNDASCAIIAARDEH